MCLGTHADAEGDQKVHPCAPSLSEDFLVHGVLQGRKLLNTDPVHALCD